MFKKQAKVFRAGTVVNVGIVATSGRPVSHTSNLTTPAGAVTADYGNTVNVTLDAYSDWGGDPDFPHRLGRGRAPGGWRGQRK